MNPNHPGHVPVRAVAVGASLGGVEVLATLLTGLPGDCRVAIFVVVHLPRDRPSLLPGNFARICRLPVQEAIDKETIMPGRVYFAPPDYHLLVDRGGLLSLSADEPVHFCRPAVDVLFESAADYYREGLLGIILSGNNEDGAAGLAAVRRAGGRAVVQEPATARGPVMPAAALRQVRDAQSLAPEQIARMLYSISLEGGL